MGLHLSVLDQSMIVSGRSPDASIRETAALAQLCDNLGYERYWLSEHHSSDSIAGSAPEVLLAALAVTTKRIRLGSAGIMLPHYATLKVAEQFRVLQALAPGRIDLGVGRAPGSDGRTAMALNPNAATAADYFPAQLRDLMAWSAGLPLVDGHPFQGIDAQPKGPGGPQIWVLGSSSYGAQVAAFFGLPYCFAYFFSDGAGAAEALDLYRENYRPTEQNPTPHSALCVLALATDTQEQADWLRGPRDMWRAERERGRYVAYPSTGMERSRTADRPDQDLFGPPSRVEAALRRIVAAHGVDELAIVTPAHDPADRRRSYTLLAQAFGLTASEPPVAAPEECRQAAD